ncbi:MAG: helix-turn-helix transcriptional regulator [Pyrinomonadaceae bacterium]
MADSGLFYARSRDEVAKREVSPQRLVHYHDNWYLDAWCHWRGGLRSFAVDSIGAAENSRPASAQRPRENVGSGARLRLRHFFPQKSELGRNSSSFPNARWVSSEQRHPRRRSRFGAEVLQIPYSDERELLMDILKHGAEVEVLNSKALREKSRAGVVALASYGRP